MGRDPDEVDRHYPCDDFVPVPALQAWRGITVRSTPEVLWPWVAQIRLAPYSYDWIDNLGRRSPQELRALPEPAVGQHFTTAATRRIGRILSVSPGEQLTGRITGAVISYVLVPSGGATRLLMKIVTARGRWLAPLLSVGDLIMARRQLLNLKQLAESSSLNAGLAAATKRRATMEMPVPKPAHACQGESSAPVSRAEVVARRPSWADDS